MSPDPPRGGSQGRIGADPAPGGGSRRTPGGGAGLGTGGWGRPRSGKRNSAAREGPRRGEPGPRCRLGTGREAP
ncbi:hypothetical protein LUU34_00845100 [Aix galericulata]|nr:hypothetical protein LUU34_00845100 [Aix galericulata]